jgi:hypothetical protein
MQSGEEKAWEILSKSDPAVICKDAGTVFDAPGGRYMLSSYGMDFSIAPEQKLIESSAVGSDILLGRLGYFFKLSLLWYMISAKDIQLSGKLVKPENMKGALNFFRGSHTMPLDRVASKYSGNIEGFLEKCAYFKGVPAHYGDAASVLLPFPRIPVTIIFWTADEEFGARLDLLMDTSCELQVPLDIVWNISMMSLLILL